MAQVIHLFKDSPEAQVAQQLEAIAEKASKGEFTNFVFAGFMPSIDGVAIAWANAKPAERRTLISHLEVDIILDVIADKYGL